jgi:hypothetical protein
MLSGLSSAARVPPAGKRLRDFRLVYRGTEVDVDDPVINLHQEFLHDRRSAPYAGDDVVINYFRRSLLNIDAEHPPTGSAWASAGSTKPNLGKMEPHEVTSGRWGGNRIAEPAKISERTSLGDIENVVGSSGDGSH